MTSADPIDIILPDTQLGRARKALATCQRKLAEQTTLESKFYYEMCIKGWQRWIATLDAQQS